MQRKANYRMLLNNPTDLALYIHVNSTWYLYVQVKIWKKAADGGWSVVKDITAHYSPVWRVSWAHPDYGAIFATCSMDHRATIWRMVGT